MRAQIEARYKVKRPVQIWVPDTRAPGFDDECRCQCRLLAEAGKVDREPDAWLDDHNRALADELDRQGQ